MIITYFQVVVIISENWSKPMDPWLGLVFGVGVYLLLALGTLTLQNKW